MLTVSTTYLRLGADALSFQVRPAGFFGNWGQVSGLQQVYARYAGPQAGAAQKGAAPLGFASIAGGTAQTLGCAQFLGDPLAGGAFAAGTWTVAFGARLANAGATYLWTARAGLYVVNGQTGARRATVFDTRSIGAAGRTSTTERSVRASVAGAAFTCFPGDYLALEVGLSVNNTGAGAIIPQADIFADGTEPIGADDTALADAQAVLVAPYAYALALPQAGEPPAPSVTFDEAVRLVRDALPPNTFHDFDDASSPDAGFLRWMAQVCKAYGWDVLDLLLREMDPLRAQAKLHDWRRLLNIQQNPPSIEGLRAIVLSRLRESGPSSLYNVATSVGTALGYADPSTLEIFEIDAQEMEQALTVTIPVGLPVPADFSFNPSNLVSRSAFVTDGGLVWPSGAKIRLTFDVDAGPLLFAELESPDGHKVQWTPISLWDPQTAVTLYAPTMAGHAVHGNWTLRVYCDPAAGVVTLTRWTLYAPGCPRAEVGVGPGVVRSGEGRWRFWWGVRADPTKYGVASPVDFGAAQSAMNRLRHASQKADLIYSVTAIPDAATTLPDGFIPT